MERVSKSEPLISVIVPIYNVEDYLSRTEKLFYDFDLVKLNNEVQEIVKSIEK